MNTRLMIPKVYDNSSQDIDAKVGDLILTPCHDVKCALSFMILLYMMAKPPTKARGNPSTIIAS